VQVAISFEDFAFSNHEAAAFEASGHPHSPGSDELLGAHRRIEFDIAGPQPRTAFIREFSCREVACRQEMRGA